MLKFAICMPIFAAALLFMIPLSSDAETPPAGTYTNPLLPSGPDPWVTRDGNTYYYMHTLGNKITIWKTEDLTVLDKAKRKTWVPPRNGPNSISIWAPELHKIDGKWYLYYTAAAAGADDDDHRGVFVLENDNADPTEGNWIDKGRVNTVLPGIDGTTFEYNGKSYFIYSAYAQVGSVLSISQMSNPWTLTGGETIIAIPDQSWEQQGGRKILEGPEFLPGPDGQLFISYSASACWSDDYALGLLSAPRGSDPTNPKAWTKSPQPVLAKSVENNVYATGHNGFFNSPDGQNWIIYHANTGPNKGCSPKRAPHIQPFTWGPDGHPVFGAPVKEGVPFEAPK